MLPAQLDLAVALWGALHFAEFPDLIGHQHRAAAGASGRGYYCATVAVAGEHIEAAVDSDSVDGRQAAAEIVLVGYESHDETCLLYTSPSPRD